MALFAARVHKGIVLARGGLKVLKERLMAGNLMSSDTGAVATYYPNSLTGLTEQVETLADGSNDDFELGQINIATGNAVEGIIKDIGTATVARITAIINRSGGVIYATVADESNMKINGQGKRLCIAKDGYVVLMEQANDLFVMLDAVGVTLVAY
jgi:hypothetical protein